MSKMIKRTLILAGVFVTALGIYFITAHSTMNRSEAVYTVMEEPTLPIAYARMYEGEESRLTPYRQEMDQSVLRESLTVLPEDRRLDIRIAYSGSQIVEAQYEIRSMDLKRLVERTPVEDLGQEGTDVRMTLPIQNLLSRDTEYMLHLMIGTADKEIIHYYTRILWTENDYGAQMMNLAREFSTKSMTPGQAGDLVTYLETSETADNSSLGHVTIKSSFSQLTWAGLDIKLEEDMQVMLKDLDGIMGQVQVQYHVSRLSESGEKEYYEVNDYYTMRWNTKRIYMMDFDRVTNQIFSGERELYSGRRLMLGIGNDEVIQLVKSPDSRYLGFVFNRDLWCYDQNKDETKAVKLFSFRSSSDESGRSSYDQHDIRIVSVSDEGDVVFLVYGYMNRGMHEGRQGISLCRYDHSGAIEERFFIPAKESFDQMKLDIEKLCYYSEKGMLYFFRGETIFGVDLSSNENIVVADGLREGTYAISSDSRKVAWQEGADDGGTVIHLFDLATGENREIRAKEGERIQCLGFVQDDFVYGLSGEDSMWILNGRQESQPMYALEIVDSDLQLQTRYEKEGSYVADVEVENARIHVRRYGRYGEHDYAFMDNDTIVCNTAVEEPYMEGIGWFASEIRRKLYFIQLDSEVKSNRTVKVAAARRITYDQSEIIDLRSALPVSGMRFYAYGQGRLLGIYEEFADAVEASYEKMGLVTDEKQRIVWNRVTRDTPATIRDAQKQAYDIIRNIRGFRESMNTDSGVTLVDARGCSLNQMLYFIGQGYPVLAYVENGAYVLLNGFDQYNVSIFDPSTGQTTKMGLNDGGEYFASHKNDFICAVKTGD